MARKPRVRCQSASRNDRRAGGVQPTEAILLAEVPQCLRLAVVIASEAAGREASAGPTTYGSFPIYQSPAGDLRFVCRESNSATAPEIITTAPTGELTGPKKKTSRLGLAAARLRRSQDLPRENSYSSSSGQPLKSSLRKQSTDERRRPSLSPLDEPVSPRISYSSATGHSNGTAGGLTALSNRPSESSRSDISPLSTPKKTPSNNPFFKLRRSKKPPEPLFPIAHLPRGDRTPGADSSTSLGVVPTPRPSSVHSAKVTRTLTDKSDVGKSAATLFGVPSAKSRQSSPTRPSFFRERSSTLSSMGRPSTDDHQTPAATRTSSSTGRKSFGDLLGMSRLRQNTDFSRQGSLTPATPGSNGSKDNSLQLAREPVVALPERRDDESAAKYLARVEEVISRGSIAAALCKEADAFYTSVLRSYMRSFSFFGEPMDMAIRKLLMEAELPKETQQIDRCLQAFANRYHECNPGIYASPDQAYFIAFSLLILHTDVFNKNNKYKMQKPDYIKNTNGEGIFDDILDCFYDNISYTPFIHVEDEIDPENERAGSTKTKKKPLLAAASDPAKRAQKEPIDPYTLIIDGNLDALRPNLKEAMHLEEHYNYLGTSSHLNLKDLQKTFFRTGVLQIISARSRPDAFMSEKTATNPDDAHPGVVDIKVTKVGLLWRKDAKKRKTRSPWQEWGAILTGAQLYFFRNTSWIKNLIHQYETHIRGGHDGIPIIFKPPLEEFKPDALMSTQGAVALHDSEYKKHKNAFLYVRSGGLDEVLLADTEDEMNDWLAKLNYAAAFRTSGVRMRGVVGSNYDGQGRRGMRRLDSSDATQLVDTPTGQVSIARGRIDQKMAEDIQLARKEFMQQKIQESDEKVQATQKQLDEQLRNARHLQVLAPIQPRSREQLLTAAGRLAAQLKWTRMEIWREKCHRDILKMDLEEDLPELSPLTTPVKSHQSAAARERSSSPTPRAKNEVNSRLSVTSRQGHKFSDLQLDRAAGPAETEDGIDSPLDQKFETPPQSATIKPGSSTSEPASADVVADHIKSLSSFGPSDPALADLQRPQSGNDLDESRSARPPTRSTQDQDDVDAEERDFLRQAGLLEARSHKDGSDKATVSTIGEGGEFGDRNKIRRSLHRTLREGAGHLSHHRSRKGKESMSNFGSEEARQESKLSRGTGSFTVHGKKASVINFGTEIQSMTTDEKLRPRKLPPCAPTDRPASPSPSNGEDDDYYSAAGDLEEQTEPLDRRESVTSESTATARSFRELHRKYSTAQAARSASTGGRLAIPSDTESDAVSFSDGRRSPLPPFDIDEAVEEDYDDDARKRAQREQDDTFLPERENVSDDEGQSSPDRLASPPIQVVNA